MDRSYLKLPNNGVEQRHRSQLLVTGISSSDEGVTGVREAAEGNWTLGGNLEQVTWESPKLSGFCIF